MPNGIVRGMSISIVISIDKAGRVVLPKNVRTEFRLTPDTELELITSAEGILLRPVAEKPSMKQSEGLWVHQGTSTTKVDWSQVVDGVRDERAADAWKA